MKRIVIVRMWVTVILVLLLLAPTIALGDTNVALNETVSLFGTFYGAAAATVVDGIFMPDQTPWQTGSVWWNGEDPYIVILLGGSCQINRLIVQADNNDTYLVSYLDSGTNSWQPAWTVPTVGGSGLITRDQSLLPPITTNEVNYNRLKAVA